MDPKMDSGLLEPEYENFDAWQERLPEEIIGIMDRLLCNEVCWLRALRRSSTNRCRWHGTSEALSRKRYSQVSTSTRYSLRCRLD